MVTQNELARELCFESSHAAKSHLSVSQSTHEGRAFLTSPNAINIYIGKLIFQHLKGDRVTKHP